MIETTIGAIRIVAGKGVAVSLEALNEALRIFRPPFVSGSGGHSFKVLLSATSCLTT